MTYRPLLPAALAWSLAAVAPGLWSAPAVGQLATPDQLWHQDVDGILGSSDEGDAFGVSQESADFNGDGYEDLALGIPGEDFEEIPNAGAVAVLYGSRSGLTAAGNQLWTQDSPGIPEDSEVSDRFASVQGGAGDFNGDGFDDLAVGIYEEDLNGAEDAGAVVVIHGSAAGLVADGSQLWHQDVPGMLDSAEPRDRFGRALGACDFDGDGFDDLAIGAWGETINDAFEAGAVQVLYGSARGLTALGNQFWHQDSPGIAETAEPDDSFGVVLSCGDYDGDGFEDLAIAAFREDVGEFVDAGVVHVLYGSASGLVSAGSQVWSQDSPGITDTVEAGDFFGQALATGNFDADPYQDLAISAPQEDWANVANAGVAHVIYGSTIGLHASRQQYWHQNSTGVLDMVERDDLFGLSLAAGDFDANGLDDLGIGVRDETIDSIPSAGAVNVLYGAMGGLGVEGNQFWHQGVPGVSNDPWWFDRLGWSQAAGDFDGDGHDSLAVGVAAEDAAADRAGAVHVLRDSLVFTDGFESGDLAAWSGAIP